MAGSDTSSAAGRIAFTYPSFVLFQLARFFIVLSGEMQSVAVGWEVYEITKRPLDLGYVGLAQFLPGILLFLACGERGKWNRELSRQRRHSHSRDVTASLANCAERGTHRRMGNRPPRAATRSA